jgi:hypothetical protein
LAACTEVENNATNTPAATLVPVPPTTAAPTATITLAPTEPPTATPTPSPVPPLNFDGDSAFAYLEAQMNFGPRWPGNPGHDLVREYIVEELENLGWAVEEQNFDYQGFAARNIIGRANQGAGPVIILGAHYDTRRIADQTLGSFEPVPGAVDGASGVAVLLELARTLDLTTIPNEIWLAFFDVEDNGREGMPGWDWIAGSSYMAENLTITPAAVVVVDMIGDADQQLYYEGNSDPDLQEELWAIAAELGYSDFFIPQLRHTMIDDHLPFARRGFVAVDIIDFDYPYWHTVEDTADKASPDSLLRVGRTLEVWLEERLES